jgi:hypothetical protein
MPRMSRVSALTAMKKSDMDKDDASFDAPEMATASAWLGIVGSAIAIVLACALWTLWN